MAQRFCYHALITLLSSVNPYSKRLFIALPEVFIAVNGEVCWHNVMIQGEMFLLIRSVGDAVFLLHLDSSTEYLFLQRCACLTGVERGGDRNERKKSEKFQQGYYLCWPVRGGSARKGYLFQASCI